MNPYLETNKTLWNTRTEIHVDSQFYDMEGFLSGKSSLTGVEVSEMGGFDFLKGKSILHLQCHFGQDTLSFAREGATVTGVDFSDKAIAFAEKTAAHLNLQAQFVCSDVLELPKQLTGEYDIVFTSFGTLGWLPDLDKWASVVRHFLKPDGFFYILEFHPYFSQHDDSGALKYDYFFSEKPDEEEVTTTYTDGPSFDKPHTEFWWNHTLSDVINALNQKGMKLEFFHEFPFSPYKLSDGMIEVTPGKWVYENLKEKIPYMYSLKMRK